MLQPTQVNLNNMLCPATSDPFHGQYYRTVAVVHQALLCPITYKLYCLAALLFAPREPDPPPKDLVDNGCLCQRARGAIENDRITNGHLRGE
ncbi:hypothetical protein PR048_031768 [Dryococelus australis]|uniref:Uncharacterized protein n=1 Tax=Dryococelus australis TaxID=614101 RepID=A0ABQ9GA75_9NEOP|nr:hypothetical protein PR048_031768 [Dryococelus australis]